jgi:hypothetical protein
MPKSGPFGAKERRDANDAQVIAFLSGYEPTWRLPSDDPARLLGAYQFEVARAEGRWTLDEFAEDL